MEQHKPFDVYEENGKFWFDWPNNEGRCGPYDERDKAEMDSAEAEARY